MKDVIIIPTYNEKENIRDILNQVTILYPNIFVWVVDDNSPDGTGSIVREFASKNHNIKLFVRREKTGLGDAYKYIHKQIQGRNDIKNIVTMDADGSHDPRDVKKMISKLNEFDLVIGSRYISGGKIEGWDKKRFLLSYFGNIYNRIITGLPVRDGTAGFVAFRSDALKKIDLSSISSAGYSYQIEFKSAFIEQGCKYLELPIVFSERQLGKSKMSGSIIFEGLLMPWRILMKDKVMKKKRFFQICTLILFIISLFVATYKLQESPSVWYDEGIYIESALNILEKGNPGFQLTPGEITNISRISVGYPFLYPLAFWMGIFGSDIVSARLFMVVILMLFLLVVFGLIRKMYGNIVALSVLLLLVTFPPLYGNGKSVLGEVPGLFYLVSSLFCLVTFRSKLKSRVLWLIIGGLSLGLAITTKPIFLLFVPALLVGFIAGLKQRTLSFRDILTFLIFAIIPFVVWIFIQFNPEDSFSSVLSAFSNPYLVQDYLVLFLNNIKILFSDVTPLYLILMLVIWFFAFYIRKREKKIIEVEEIISFAFCCLIVIAYLRIVGAYRYIFPAQIFAIIFFVPSLLTITEWLKRRLINFGQYVRLIPISLITLFVIAGVYGLCFNSWVANYYNSDKTTFWKNYFLNKSPSVSYFFYDTPEVAIFYRNRNYYQYIMPNNWPFSIKELNIIKTGQVDRIVMRLNTYEEKAQELRNNYHPILQKYKYIILSKN